MSTTVDVRRLLHEHHLHRRHHSQHEYMGDVSLRLEHCARVGNTAERDHQRTVNICSHMILIIGPASSV